MPSAEVVQKALHAIKKRYADYEYFFSKLESPDWLIPLWTAGLFQQPPQPQKDGEYIQFPVWPESRYLSRMASLNPALVLRIITKIPNTDNPRVHEDLVDAALKMPPELAARMVEKATTWTRSAYQLLLPEKLGALVSHLAKGGQVEASLIVAHALLEVLPDPKATEISERTKDYGSPRPRARFDTWEYEQILKKDFPEVAKAAGIEAVRLICDLLEVAINFSRRGDADDSPIDYSYIWRRAIEDHPQDQHHNDLRDLLVSAVRDTAEQVARANPSNVTDVVTILASRPWRIFHRILFYLLARMPSAAPSLVASYLTDRQWFNEVSVRHEYADLLRKGFESLTSDQKETILGWIKKGPDLENFKEYFSRQSGRQPTDIELDRYQKVWQRDHLAWFTTGLPADYKRWFNDLVAEFGKPEHPDFPVWTSSGWVGPTSPKSTEELRTLDSTQLIEFLRSWRPPKDHFAPSLEGLGRNLTSVISENPAPYAEVASRFEGLDPTFVRSVLRGLEEASKARKAFDWSPVLALCDWIVRQPRDIPNRDISIGDGDPDWGWARKAVASLLSAGFDVDGYEIPFNLRLVSWSVLRPLTDDPEPSAEYATQMDMATLSINTVRGEAMHTLIRFALWVHRHLRGDDQQGREGSFDEMPEVREILDVHVQPSIDPSLAVRSVYGQWFPSLVVLDAGWARERAPQIFPLHESLREFRNSSWETYIRFCHPYDDVFDILRDQYVFAVEHLGVDSDYDRENDYTRRLAEHLILFYWRGKIDDDPDSPLTNFWLKAPYTLRHYALEFIGRSLWNIKESLQPDGLRRMQTLWERRLSAARTASDTGGPTKEITAFGWWFASGKFDSDWAIEQLLGVIRVAGTIDPDYMVVDRLATLAPEMPDKAAKCLEALVKGDRQRRSIYIWRNHARTILSAALRDAGSEAATTAENIIHYLGSRGFFEFRDLLQR